MSDRFLEGGKTILAQQNYDGLHVWDKRRALRRVLKRAIQQGRGKQRGDTCLFERMAQDYLLVYEQVLSNTCEMEAETTGFASWPTFSTSEQTWISRRVEEDRKKAFSASHAPGQRIPDLSQLDMSNHIESMKITCGK